jgi:hypothetical protein
MRRRLMPSLPGGQAEGRAGRGEADEAGQGAEPRKSPVMLRFDRALLAKVDAAAKRRGISRSAWIQFTVSRALDAGEG